jgi:multiple sugar transport system permease protein
MTAGISMFRSGLTNSLIVALSTTALLLVTAIFSGYAFARFRFKWMNPVFLCIILTVPVPALASLIGLFRILSQLGLTDSILGLILIYWGAFLPITLWLIRSYIETVPEAVEDAARTDGCSRIGALFRVVLPICGPGLVSSGIYAFLQCWNELAIAVVITASVASKTLPVVLSSLISRYDLEYNLICAAGIMAIIPPIVITVALQKYLVRGLTMGVEK